MTTNVTKSPDNTDLILERTFPVGVEKMWSYWTNPELVAQWYGPHGMQTEVTEFDLREGGKYRLGMKGEEGVYWVSGIFKAVDEPNRLVHTWKWDNSDANTLVELTFAADGDGTKVTLTHTGFPADEARDQHEHGWLGTFESLANFSAG